MNSKAWNCCSRKREQRRRNCSTNSVMRTTSSSCCWNSLPEIMKGVVCAGGMETLPQKRRSPKPTHRGFTENAWIRVSFHPRKSLSSSSSPFLLLSCQFRNSHGQCRHNEVGKMLMYSGALYGDIRRRVRVQSTITNSSIKLGKLRLRYNRSARPGDNAKAVALD